MVRMTVFRPLSIVLSPSWFMHAVASLEFGSDRPPPSHADAMEERNSTLKLGHGRLLVGMSSEILDAVVVQDTRPLRNAA